jgi:hypothetical protein
VKSFCYRHLSVSALYLHYLPQSDSPVSIPIFCWYPFRPSLLLQCYQRQRGIACPAIAADSSSTFVWKSSSQQEAKRFFQEVTTNMKNMQPECFRDRNGLLLTRCFWWSRPFPWRGVGIVWRWYSIVGPSRGCARGWRGMCQRHLPTPTVATEFTLHDLGDPASVCQNWEYRP